MAAATIALQDVDLAFGNKRVTVARLTTPADTNTYDTALSRIDSVHLTRLGTSNVGNDTSVSSISGGVITLSVVGTALDVFVIAVGN